MYLPHNFSNNFIDIWTTLEFDLSKHFSYIEPYYNYFASVPLLYKEQNIKSSFFSYLVTHDSLQFNTKH